MFVTTYIVKVCDKDPLGNGQKNIIPYKFASQRRALNFVKDALSRGLFAVLNRVEMEVEGEE